MNAPKLEQSDSSESPSQTGYPFPRFSIWGEAWIMWQNRPQKVMILSIIQKATYHRKPILRERTVNIVYGISEHDHGWTQFPKEVDESQLFRTKDELLDSL